MQTLTPELTAILKDTFQAAASGFRARFELDNGFDSVEAIESADGGGGGSLASSWAAPPISPAGDPVLLVAALQVRPIRTIAAPAGWTLRVQQDNAADDIRSALLDKIVTGGTPPYSDTFGVTGGTSYWSMGQLGFLTDGSIPANTASAISSTFADSSDIVTRSVTASIAAPTPGNVLVAYVVRSSYAGIGGGAGTSLDGFRHLQFIPPGDDHLGGSDLYYRVATGLEADITVEHNGAHQRTISLMVVEYPIQSTTALEPTAVSGLENVSIDKSLRLVADQAEVTFSNESLPLGWGPTSIFETNRRCRIFQWYGAEVNEIQVFTGLIDSVRDSRDVPKTTVTLRDLMAILIDQTFSSIGPQGAGEDGAIRTTANGVYLSMEVSDIVTDILERAGWPLADRDVVATSYVLDEFIVSDGASWAETIIGDSQLTGLVGYSAWADEMGVFHFAPTLVSQNLTDPDVPAYTFRSGEDIVSLDDQTDQYDLRTRVKVRGPLTTTTLEDTWRELWRTSKITEPVGIWYDPTVPTIIRVISRSTKRLYRLQQSDRAVLGSSYLGSVIPHPLGLSGDPADSSVYWVLDAPWIYTGSTSGNSVKKVRKSDNHVLASYSIPSGRWSALKVSSSYLWLTNLDTDRFYKRDKSDGSAIANYSHTYHSVVQANPSGIMVDGTTLYLFWSNGGTTARFLVCDESAPGTITKVVKTAGTALHGGEMDTTTHTECWGDSDSLNLVAKFSLLAAVDQTDEVSTEVIDIALEDDLGALAQLEDRIHDAHTGDAAHPYEVRRLTLDLTVITNIAQATQTAQRQLDIASQRRRVLDTGIVGNPGLQKTDYVAVIDPVTGISTGFAVDTYRTAMQADGTYLGTVALLPVEDVSDDPTDDGDAS